MRFSELLSMAMGERDMTDADLARRLFISQNVPNRWRNGRMVPKDDVLPGLVEHLGYDEDTWARSMRAERRAPKGTVDRLRAEIAELRAELDAERAENARLRRRRDR